MSDIIEFPNSTQILEIRTEDFVGVISVLTCHGYRVTAHPQQGRHVVDDELPTPSAAQQ